MQIKYEIFENQGLLMLKFIGKWSFADYKNILDKMIHKPGFKEVYKILSDFREISLEEAYHNIKDLVEIREKIIKKIFTCAFNK